ncbi:hypothetical protein [uncultured Gimesia sp.]|uniref:hypothetical protein n=1 Tax=uncultured Gimesia sp. TaxID=1678688 RepID=UPI002629FBC7|nr:hypothetical protein [uncultured Gimesia sp.]
MVKRTRKGCQISDKVNSLPQNSAKAVETAEQVFRVVLQPINEYTTTDKIVHKLKIMFGSIGLKITEAERVEDEGQE